MPRFDKKKTVWNSLLQGFLILFANPYIMTEQCYRSAVLNKVKSSRCTTLMSEEPRITETFIYWLHTWTTNPTTLTALLSFKNLNSVYVQHQKKERKKKRIALGPLFISFTTNTTTGQLLCLQKHKRPFQSSRFNSL